MKVGVLCELSGVVRDAFIEKGHDAVSCDLLPTESPGPHYKGDVFNFLNSGSWDLIIAFPPCTALCVAGNRYYGAGKPKHKERYTAISWTQRLWDKCLIRADSIGFENPVGVLSTMADFPKPQYVQPWQFGHGETKKTALYLHNLPELTPTNIVPGREQRIWKMGPSKDRAKLRSITYQGIADAMAEQWG